MGRLLPRFDFDDLGLLRRDVHVRHAIFFNFN